MQLTKQQRRKRIQRRVRRKIIGTASRPRLSVYRSNTHIYCQLIDDGNNHTMISASSKELGAGIKGVEQAKAVGKLIADKAKNQNIENCVFDRSGYLYHGRVKALAEGARENGLNI